MQTTRVLSETIVHFWEAPKKLPCRPSRATMYRWRDSGCRVRSGDSRTFITIEWCYAGAQPITSLEAYFRFQKRLNGELEVVTQCIRTNRKMPQRRKK